MKTFKFEINDYGDNGAGLMAFTDEVMITVKSGDFGDHDGETGFVLMATDFLREWYDAPGIKFKGSI